MTRIIAGKAGGRRIRTLPGDTTRPTSDRVREALFSAVESHLGSLSARSFLDVYAGSGAVGLEARSRGCTAVTLVEHNAAAARLIRSNAHLLGFPDVTVLATRAERLAEQPAPAAGFDVAFFDPPYAQGADDVVAVVVALAAAGWYSAAALLVVERSRRDRDWTWPTVVEHLRVKRYGETMLWYGRLA